MTTPHFTHPSPLGGSVNLLIKTVLAVHTRATRRPARDQRGSVTIEHILWAIAVIAIVGIAVAAIKAYADNNSSLIR